MRDTTLFVAACCRWPHDAAAQDAVRAAAERVESWQAARDAVSRHRVHSLVHEAVRNQECVPEAFRVWVQNKANDTLRHAMQLTGECIAIDAVLKQAGLSPLHVKGPVLGQMVYDSVGRKFSRDLDILVSEAEAPAALETLQDRGYRKFGSQARVSPAQARALIRHCKDISLVGPPGNVIELHWHLTHTRTLFEPATGPGSRQAVQVAGKAELQTFNNEQMVHFLCLHGALHHWVRLKWLAELDAFLNQLDPSERTALLGRAGRSSHADAVAQALKLCDTFFGASYRPRLSHRAEVLYQHALKRIDEPFLGAESLRGDGRLLVDMLKTRHLYPSSLAGLWALKSHLIGQEDVMTWPLPRYLNGAYVLIRLPSLIVRRLWSRMRALQGRA